MEPEYKLGSKNDSPVATDVVGKRLKSARKKAGLSIQEVAERTRVPARHLVAFEEGRFQDLPALAYSSGFARSFAPSAVLAGAEIAAQSRCDVRPAPLPFFDQHQPLHPVRVPLSQLASHHPAVRPVIVRLQIGIASCRECVCS